MLLSPRRPDYWLTAGDTARRFDVQLLDVSGKPVNLEHATAVTMRLKQVQGGILFNYGMKAVNAERGVVRLVWPINSTQTAGDYWAQFQVNFAGRTDTYPKGDRSHILIRIEERL